MICRFVAYGGPTSERLADLIGTVLASLRNHDGKGVQRTNEGSPAKWKLKGPLTEAASGRDPSAPPTSMIRFLIVVPDHPA
jgi:hypothetical protein